MGKLHWFERLLMGSPLRRWQLNHLDAPLLFRGVRPGQYGRVLEIGCGTGVGTLNVLRRLQPSNLVACDVDTDMVRQASSYVRKHQPAHRVTFVVADASALPFETNSFNAIVSFAVLHHVANYESVIAEVSRLLKPGGVYFIAEVLQEAHAWPVNHLMPAEALFDEHALTATLEEFDLPAKVQAHYFPGCIFLRCDHTGVRKTSATYGPNFTSE